MFEAHKDCWRKQLAIKSNGMVIRHYLAGVHVQGNLIVLAKNDRPTLYFANHVTCWDGMLAGYLSHTYFRQDPFIMTAEDRMNARTTWDGNFSISKYDNFSAAQSLRYSIRLLQEVPRCALWIFPQGMVLPFGRRPLSLQKGLATIVSQMKEVRVIPVAFYYTIITHRKSEAFVSFGEPFDVIPEANLPCLITQLEGCLSEHLDKLGHDLRNGNTQSFRTLLYGDLNFRDQLDRLRGIPTYPLKTWDSPRQSVDRF